jgi:cyclopropane fatty-acyl-phospholipid synthase-like methyltransferase
MLGRYFTKGVIHTLLKKISIPDLVLWTLRRNEKDTIKMYDFLSDIMKVATGGDMLNFGFWDDDARSPLDAQKNMCRIFGKTADLKSELKVVDIGSGFSTPASIWNVEYSPIDLVCVDVNFTHLQISGRGQDKTQIQKNDIIEREKITRLNATSRLLPFKSDSVDRVLALESAQHFKPLGEFLSDSFRILKDAGLLAMAIPVVEKRASFAKLGMLSFTWSSEHYAADYVTSEITRSGFEITSLQKVGSNVYAPLADYYLENRKSIGAKILKMYPQYVEKILAQSLQKMKSVSQEGIIDYLFVVCKK